MSGVFKAQVWYDGGNLHRGRVQAVGCLGKWKTCVDAALCGKEVRAEILYE
jgi:hypothetical protein